MTNLDSLLIQLHNCTDVSGFTHGELERRACEFACKGCGLGKLCKKGTENYLSCNECHKCAVKKFNDCTKKHYWRPQCFYCFWCGCPKCNLDIKAYEEGVDNNPYYMYRERYNKNIVKITEALKQSPVLDAWMPLLEKHTIRNNFPWETYSNYWRTYLFDTENPMYCTGNMYKSLSDEDKIYFIDPSAEYECDLYVY